VRGTVAASLARLPCPSRPHLRRRPVLAAIRTVRAPRKSAAAPTGSLVHGLGNGEGKVTAAGGAGVPFPRSTPRPPEGASPLRVCGVTGLGLVEQVWGEPVALWLPPRCARRRGPRLPRLVACHRHVRAGPPLGARQLERARHPKRGPEQYEQRHSTAPHLLSGAGTHRGH
jgi:hypothetical protein